MVKLEKVKKQYKDFSLDCSFEIPTGQVTGIIGRNGAGKTTAFKAMLGLIKIDGGTVELFGKNIRDLTVKDRERIGVVLADSGFGGYLTIKDYVPMLDAMYHDFSKETFVSECERMGLPLKKKIKEFSTGMKRKLQILTALSHNADLLVLDEPTAGLDPKGRDDILEQIAFLHKQTGMTVILVSHSMEDIARFADRIIVMNHGEVMYNDEPKKVFTHYKELEEVGLAAPQVTYIMHDLKEQGLNVNVDVTTVEEAADEIMRVLEMRK